MDTIFLGILAVLLIMTLWELKKLRTADKSRRPDPASLEEWHFEGAGEDAPAEGNPPVSGPVREGRKAEDPLSSKALRKICRDHHIRRLSLLGCDARPAGGLRVLVELEDDAKRDYSISFRLPQELFLLFGQQVKLVFASQTGSGGSVAGGHPRVLYAA